MDHLMKYSNETTKVSGRRKKQKKQQQRRKIRKAMRMVTLFEKYRCVYRKLESKLNEESARSSKTKNTSVKMNERPNEPKI